MIDNTYSGCLHHVRNATEMNGGAMCALQALKLLDFDNLKGRQNDLDALKQELEQGREAVQKRLNDLNGAIAMIEQKSKP
jgi:hypothetical protein